MLDENEEFLNSLPPRAFAHCLIEAMPVEALKEATEYLRDMYQFYKNQENDIVNSLQH